MAFTNGQIAQCPPHPIALPEEHIALAETTIVIQRYSNRWYSSKFTVGTTSSTLLFTAGPKSLRAQCREFVDASGLPLFELHSRWLGCKRWSVALPGGVGRLYCWAP